MKIITFAICDDIRREIGSKHSLMGVYNGDIIFNVTPDKKDSWPKRMGIGIYAAFDLEKDKPHSFTLNMKYNEKDQLLGKGKRGELDNLEKNKCTVAMVNHDFVFHEPGFIKFTYDFFDADGKKIKTFTPNFELKIRELVIK